MHRVIVLFVVSLFFVSTVSAQMQDGKQLVVASLHTAATDFTKPFTVALRFKIADEWHLYWKNAGDAGLPIAAKWSLPNGYTAGDLQFPTPEKIVQAGIVAYGYEHQVVLLADISPSPNAPTLTELSVALDWLVCKETCIPGDAKLTLTLSTLSAKDRADAEKLIEATRNALPRPLSESGVALDKAQLSGKTLTMIFSGDKATSITDFFPETVDGFLFNYLSINATGGKVTLSLTPESKTVTLQSLHGLVIIDKMGYELAAKISVADNSGGGTEGSAAGGLLDQQFKTDGSTGLPLWLALVFAFIGGLILNVMPCVLPVLSLKVLSFVEHSGQSSAKSRAHGVMFGLGVLASFWALALVIVLFQQAGEQIGWGFQFQSPLFVIGMTTVIFIFGLNLAGVFEFQAPSVSGEVGGALSRRDAVGAFMNGVLATTLATPCTAPFLGSALGFAFSQPASVIFVIFSVIAAGLAAPYMILAAKPEWLKFVPKPGEWMNRFKQFMGFLLFATVIWLLTVLGGQWGAEGVTATVAWLLGVALAAWLVGAFIDFTSSAQRKAAVWISVTLVVGLSYFIAFENLIQWRKLDGKSVAQTAASGGDGIAWRAFSVKAVEEAVQSGKPVFIDFTADWCFTCKVTEKTVLETDVVRQKISELGIVPLRADWTTRNDEITQLLRKFGRSGVPLYVVFPAGKLNEPMVLPEVISVDLLIDAFTKAASTATVDAQR